MSTDEQLKNADVSDDHVESFAETALKLGGKSADEARRTGAIDEADDSVEKLFKPQYQTVNSPAHRAIWDKQVPIELFQSSPNELATDVRKVMDDSINIVRRNREAATLMDEHQKITVAVMNELAEVGYWGLLVDKDYGGTGAPFKHFASFLTEMSMQDPTIAGLASVHGCIGAVDPVSAFGSEEQKQEYLPKLASGERLSAFALTEPCAGSDLTALRTRAELRGEHYVVTGEKLFITNVVPGRTIGLVCLVEDNPAVLIVDLPDEENDNFQLRKYGLWALKHTYNQGIIFRDFKVPAKNLLQGHGLTIAYHGLNLGRVALCANAAGTIRLMMASMIPWAHFRVTYGEEISKRELVKRRLGSMAGMVVACDALVAWCSQLLDEGYRGEMECVIAKIFGSELQKEAAIEMFMKTHGGRSFLHGHMFGDNVHEYLAPCIYEGEGEMLGMAFFKSLVKHHGKTYFEPVGKSLKRLQDAGIKKPNPMNPLHAWKMRDALIPYSKWLVGEQLRGKSKASLPSMPSKFRDHAEYAAVQLQKGPLEISGTMRKHQLSLADRQCRMSELSSRMQTLVTILCTSLYAARQSDEVLQDAADVYCQEMRRKLSGRRPSDRYFRSVTKLGETIVDGGFQSISGVQPAEILMGYEKS